LGRLKNRRIDRVMVRSISGPVERALETELERARAEGRWGDVAQLARELERRQAAEVADVVMRVVPETSRHIRHFTSGWHDAPSRSGLVNGGTGSPRL
jgi:hypothetical protein